jgi:hypothetical protein
LSLSSITLTSSSLCRRIAFTQSSGEPLAPLTVTFGE